MSAPAGQPGQPLPANIIAVCGADRAGAAALASALARRLAAETGLRCTRVSLLADADLLAHDLVVWHADPSALPADWLHVALTLLTALDPLHCDPSAEATDAALRGRLQAAGLPWVLVSGAGPARVETAIDAVAPLLRAWRTPRNGLLTRLARRNAMAPQWQWVCETCDVPECEHAQLVSSAHRRQAAGPPAG